MGGDVAEVAAAAAAGTAPALATAPATSAMEMGGPDNAGEMFIMGNGEDITPITAEADAEGIKSGWNPPMLVADAVEAETGAAIAPAGPEPSADPAPCDMDRRFRRRASLCSAGLPFCRKAILHLSTATFLGTSM